MFHIKKVGMISSACICNSRRGRLLFEWPWRDSTKMWGAMYTALDSKPWQYSGMRSLEKHSIVGLTAIRLYSDWSQHWYSLLQQRLKLYLPHLKGVYAFGVQLSSYCTRSWHNTSNPWLCISLASRRKFPFGRAKSIAKQTRMYSLSYDMSCVCFFHC